MPILESEKIITTKVRGVTEGGQSTLLLMYKAPENIVEIFVQNGKVSVVIEETFPFTDEKLSHKFEIGHIKDEYLPLMDGMRYRVKKFKITGGHKLEGFSQFRAYLGLNIEFSYEHKD